MLPVKATRKLLTKLVLKVVSFVLSSIWNIVYLQRRSKKDIQLLPHFGINVSIRRRKRTSGLRVSGFSE